MLALVEDDAIYSEDSRGEGYAPLHAIELLGAIRWTAAIPSLLRVVTTADELEIAYGVAIHALQAIGAPVLEPALAAFAGSQSERLRASLAEVLAGIGVLDERIYQLLVANLAHDITLGAYNFVTYGDPRALPQLSRLLDECALRDDDWHEVNRDPIELAGAIERLGGQLTEAQTFTLERSRASARAWAHLMSGTTELAKSPVTVTARLGRNEPCHCGSGKKYKKCHLHEDERASPA